MAKAADYEAVLDSVASCKRLLGKHGISCSTTAEDLIAWFQADTPYPDITLDELLHYPLLVAHELVEIEEVKRMGLQLTKDVILKNPEAVDRAHAKASYVEVRMAAELGDVEYLRSRIDSIASWISNPLSTEECKKEYARIYDLAAKAIQDSRRG